jgi:2-keto-4-pentenoate hydratase
MSNLSENAIAVSEAFLAARREARALDVFPGEALAGREEAYAVQERLIAAWGRSMGGWKTGFVPAEHQAAFGSGFIAGPLFRNRMAVAAPGERIATPVFRGGFLSVEGEWAFRLTEDLGERRTAEDIAEICDLHGGVEIAASPFEPIDTAGPLPVVADLGNNNGFVLGPKIEGWRKRGWETLDIRMSGDAEAQGDAAGLPSNPLDCLVFLAGHLAARGRTLKAGDVVTTGNVAGAMRPPIGSVLRFDFAGAGGFEIEVTEEQPVEDRVVFEERFDGGALDRKVWNVEGPDFWVNREEQAYVDSSDTVRLLPAGTVDGAEGGVLELRALHKPGFETPNGRQTDIVSGRIDTRGKFDFTHGRAEARIRMPAAAGVWPAFWLLGNGEWPETGEIDIMEYVGEPDWVGAAVHGPGYSGDTPHLNKLFFPEGTDATEWHVYGVDWNSERMLFTVDGLPVQRVTRPMVELYGPWRFDTPKYMILNLAIGGEFPRKINGVQEPHYGLPPATLARLQESGLAIQIDWVRVSQTVETG